MNRDVYEAVQDSLRILREFFPERQPLSGEGMKIYLASLGKLTPEQIRTATRRACEECTYFPKLAELLKFAGAADSSGRAMKAWQVVRRSLSAVGHLRSVDFGDPAVHGAIRELGGWITLCLSDSRDLDFMAKRFAEVYDRLSTTGVDEHHGRYLAGKDEAQAMHGQWVMPRARVSIDAPMAPPRRALPAVPPPEVSEEDAARARELVRQLAEAAAAKGGEP